MKLKEFRGALGPLAVVGLFVSAALWSPLEPHPEPVIEGAFDRPLGEATWPEEDWSRFAETVRWAMAQRVDTLSLGDAMADIGRSFVGTAYVPGTLEAEGPERVIINFRGLDCVTFVENVFALSRFSRGDFGGDVDLEALLADRPAAERTYEILLAEHRYRDGTLDGYASRLHYFTDWVGDNERRGFVRDVTGELGGSVDQEPIDFMSTHTDAYRQLGDSDNLRRVRLAETRLSATGRSYLPEDRIADAASGIRNGDIIAATSTVAGLDVAHTGLALWIDDELHLLHAPLVGEAVQISEVPLADRVRRISGQDGIIVARPNVPSNTSR